LAFSLHSNNWLTFEAWEFNPRRQAGYLDDVAFFNRERGVGLTKDEEDEDEGHDDEKDDGQEDTLFINDAAPDASTNLEIQPPYFTVEEAFELAIV
jgi:hypothetical protein